MNGHDDYYDLIDYEDQNKQYNEDGDTETMDSMDMQGNKIQVPFEDINDVDWNFGEVEEQEEE